LISRVDESSDPWVKVSFYSDEVVTKILDRVYDRWVKSGCRGEPITYLTDDELEELYIRSNTVTTSNQLTFIENMLSRAIYGDLPKKKRIPKILKLFMRLFLPSK